MLERAGQWLAVLWLRSAEHSEAEREEGEVRVVE